MGMVGITLALKLRRLINKQYLPNLPEDAAKVCICAFVQAYFLVIDRVQHTRL